MFLQKSLEITFKFEGHKRVIHNKLDLPALRSPFSLNSVVVHQEIIDISDAPCYKHKNPLPKFTAADGVLVPKLLRVLHVSTAALPAFSLLTPNMVGPVPVESFPLHCDSDPLH